MHSEICPICLGSGKIACECGSGTKVCHGCGGKGWVEVSDGYTPYIWPYTWPYVQPYQWDTQPYKWVSDDGSTARNSNNDNVIVTFEFIKKGKKKK